ncbi:fibronectin type III domain-containing protein [Candidatus Gracilibacteria bacterium]|nr:fibronectin type III domain-containing protein [Candidatus Gracilibacteria bacterium]
MIKRKAFTLVELILVIAVFAILVGAVFSISGGTVVRAELKSNTEQLENTIRLAHTRSIAALNNSQWGVHIDASNDKFVLFKGSTYAGRDSSFDITTTLPSAISLSNLSLGGATDYIVFDKGSGETSNNGTFDIGDIFGTTTTISINAKGLLGTATAAPDSIAPDAISNLATTSPTSTSIGLTWSAPGDDGSTGTATTYDVRYSTSTINDGNFAAATAVTGEPTPSVAGSSESMTVTGLTASTTYYFAMKTSDEIPNISAISNVPNSTTLAPDTTAPAAVSDLAASSPTLTTIDLDWTAPGDDGSTGTATTYDIRYSTSTITAGNFAAATAVTGEPTPSVAGSSESMTVTSLSNSTTYYFAIKATDEAANTSTISNVSNSTTLTPDTTAPAAISDLNTDNPSSNTIDLTWTAPGDDGSSGTATTYDVRYSTSTITAGNWGSATAVTSGEPTPAVAGSSESMTVTGLSNSTTYYFAIKTSDEVPNESAISNVPNDTTDAPSQVDSLVVSTSGANIGGGGNKELKGITLQNTSGSTIVIAKITVTWTNGQKIQEIKIDGDRIWKHNNEGSPDGRQNTGTEIDNEDYDLAASSTVNIDKFKFNGNMTGDTFTIKFELGDGSTVTISSFSP